MSEEEKEEVKRNKYGRIIRPDGSLYRNYNEDNWSKNEFVELNKHPGGEVYNKHKFRGYNPDRPHNQIKYLKYPWDLTENATRLLRWLKINNGKRYATMEQMADIIGIRWRKLAKNIAELKQKGRISSYRDHSDGYGTNRYEILDFDPIEWCDKNGLNYHDFVE